MNIVVSETNTSTWDYHLRKVGDEGVKLGGGVGLISLCGEPLGWDTAIPLEYYGHEGAFCRWCKKCHEIYLKGE